jgi:hypothetical protein
MDCHQWSTCNLLTRLYDSRGTRLDKNVRSYLSAFENRIEKCVDFLKVHFNFGAVDCAGCFLY